METEKKVETKIETEKKVNTKGEKTNKAKWLVFIISILPYLTVLPFNLFLQIKEFEPGDGDAAFWLTFAYYFYGGFVGLILVSIFSIKRFKNSKEKSDLISVILNSIHITAIIAFVIYMMII